MQSTNRALMVQGTTSDAGKSVLVAGLCRVLARRGKKVAPFKPQNMALNSAVTPDGGEIGRAQAVQALAARIEPSVHMNPVLLKPNTDMRAQVIFQGKASNTIDAIGYDSYKNVAMPYVMDSFSILQDHYDTIVIEGAGSPAEINLRENDIANMGFAEQADVPVIIIADIDRGGVFAHLYGTLALLSKSEQRRVKGFVINRFRGDIALLRSGLEWLEQKTSVPVVGVIPYLHGLDIEAEDAIDVRQECKQETKINVVIPILPRISNHTDFDALRSNPDIKVKFVAEGEPIIKADLIILPGSKSVRSDLDYLRSQGWDKDIARHLRFGGKVMGICGGFQMLGNAIHDPYGVEGQPGSSQGLDYLDVETELKEVKTLTNVTGVMSIAGVQVDVAGYEIHAGITTHAKQHLIDLNHSHTEGAISDCNQVLGTYLHGIFDCPDAVTAICQWAGGEDIERVDHKLKQQQAIDRLADTLEQHLDLKLLWPDLYHE